MEVQPFCEKCSTKISNWIGMIMFDDGHEIRLSFSTNPIMARSEIMQSMMEMRGETYFTTPYPIL